MSPARGVLDERQDSPAATPRARWAGAGHVGTGEAPDSQTAGRLAAERATDGREPELVLVFSSQAHDLAALSRGITSVTNGAQLVGCTTAGEISQAGVSDGGVVVMALGGPGIAASTAIGRITGDRVRDAGNQAAACLGDLGETGSHRVLMLLIDGVGCNHQDVIRGVHQTIGSGVPLVGGCAGDGMQMRKTFQLHGEEVTSGSVVAAAVASEAPVGIGWSHGWERVGEPMLITRAEGNRVLEIDNRPALDEYLDRLEAPVRVREDSREFASWARTHPLGLGRRRNGHTPVRCVSEADPSSRAIVCTGEVPPGGMAWFMRGTADSVLRSTAAACEDATVALDGAQAQAMLVFDCIGRRGVLGEERTGDEVERIRAAAPDAAIAGLYTYGEIGRIRGVNALHSQTVVAMAVA